jgi:choline dehydrogenase-like flavoprotein
LTHVTVVGSGPSGIHFALTLLGKGHRVTLLDAGEGGGPAPIRLEDDLRSLKTNLEDPVQYFLGTDFESLILPDSKEEFYGFPPNKMMLFRRPPGVEVRAHGLEPLLAYAPGGLAEAWTAGVYPYDDADLGEFPIDHEDLSPYYGEVARRIGITGRADDLASFMPLHDHLEETLDLDAHSQLLLQTYARRRRTLNRGLGFYVGHSRIAVLSRDRNGRRACAYLGRCLWGCPRGSLYTPSLTLEECLAYPAFHYRPGLYVEAFRYGLDRRIEHVEARSLRDGHRHEIPVETLVLAAGTLSSARIFLESIHRQEGRAPRLTGLMDNRQILIPFLNLRRLGRPESSRNYQYHQLCLGLVDDRGEPYVHGQITTLTTALVHPVIERIPMDMPAALSAFRQTRAALGVINVNLHDTRRSENVVELDGDGDQRALRISYRPPDDEPARLRRVILRIKKALHRLGCVVPPRGIHVRPMGASVHYAGTLPMSPSPRALTTSIHGRSHDFRNLYVVDGSTFPFLPAKNLTFTLMANAVRVAEEAF